MLKIIREVNNIVSAYKSEKYLSNVDSLLAVPSTNDDDAVSDELELADYDEEDMFQLQKGNVVFACALDGWGFRINDFAKFYAGKEGGSVSEWQRALWGPHYYVQKTKRIVGKAGEKGASKECMFVLKSLWDVYRNALEGDGDNGFLQKVVKIFNLSVPSRELQNKDPKARLQAIMSRCLPLADTVLSMVVECVPNPVSAQSSRISRLLPERGGVGNGDNSDVLNEARLVRKSIEICDSSPNAPCCAFVSKMFAVPIKMLPRGEILNDFGDEGDSGKCFLAFARIFSGVLVAGHKVFVLSALYDPLKAEQNQKHIQEAEVQLLYLMMGQGLESVASVEAGNIVAIRGLSQQILKSATLSSTIRCWPFSSMTFQVTPILKVAIEPLLTN